MLVIVNMRLTISSFIFSYRKANDKAERGMNIYQDPKPSDHQNSTYEEIRTTPLSTSSKDQSYNNMMMTMSEEEVQPEHTQEPVPTPKHSDQEYANAERFMEGRH